MAKYGQASIAGITLGFPIPYVILSRSDTLDTRLESISLCSLYRYRIVQQTSNSVQTGTHKFAQNTNRPLTDLQHMVVAHLGGEHHHCISQTGPDRRKQHCRFQW